MGEFVTCEVTAGIGTLVLRNPPLNIITSALRTEFLAETTRLQRDAQVRAVIITGAGVRAFCAGADLREEETIDAPAAPEFPEEDSAFYRAVERLPMPVIAAINGHCVGGGLELALSCDIRVVAEDAKLCGAGVRVGLVANVARLTRLVGPAIAKDLLLTGRTFNGRDALRLGLASAAVPRDAVLDEALACARDIASRAPLAVRRTKQAISQAADLPFDEAIAEELQHFAQLVVTEDHKAAVAAFFRHEEPRFHAR